MDLLSKLADKHRTDKGPWHHNYTPTYHRALKPWYREIPELAIHFTLLEIGIGGYEYPDRGGESLKMWAEYFPKANIVGIDIHDKSGIDALQNKNVKTYKGSQTDIEFLSKLITVIGNPSIIIDDGSHISADVIFSFQELFNVLTDGGLYIIEDTETAYWSEHFYGCADIQDHTHTTTMTYFQLLTHYLNRHAFGHNERHIMVELAETIDSITFHKNIIIIKKK